jgi:hypothetical protein
MDGLSRMPDPRKRRGFRHSQISLVRGHWGIEANHWTRDAVFGEDKRARRKGSAPVFMALLGNLAIALLRLSGRNQIASSLRYFSWNPSRALSFLGF